MYQERSQTPDHLPELGECTRVRAAVREIAARLGFTHQRIFDIQVAVGEALEYAIEPLTARGPSG